MVSHSKRWLALALLCLTGFMIILDASIVLVAVPSIERELTFSTGGAQWVPSGYGLMFGGLLLLGGRISDLLGRRRVFMPAWCCSQRPLCCAGSRGLVTRWSSHAGYRAIAAAVLAPSALSIVMTTFPAGRGSQQGARDLGSDQWGRRYCGFARRRTCHGGTRLAVDLLHQRAGLPAGRCTGARTAAGQPWTGTTRIRRSRCRHRHRSTRSSSCTPSSRHLTSSAGGPHCWRSRPPLCSHCSSLVEKRSAAPLVPLRIFRSRALVGGNLITIAWGLAAFGLNFVYTQYAQLALGVSAIRYGLHVRRTGSSSGRGVHRRSAPGHSDRHRARSPPVTTGRRIGSDADEPAHRVDSGYFELAFWGLTIFGAGLGAGTVAGSIAALSDVAGRGRGSRVRTAERVASRSAARWASPRSPPSPSASTTGSPRRSR